MTWSRILDQGHFVDLWKAAIVTDAIYIRVRVPPPSNLHTNLLASGDPGHSTDHTSTNGVSPSAPPSSASVPGLKQFYGATVPNVKSPATVG
ncbi:hypothetical protein H257_08751 [Aphanomyces astaci]|uniref:Uncharacterized protein n=1 Tax=Aphanomyces astaci TaxID=112090 RepID=W4GEA9_APHAT|nr:hypothetical protein H257_08751 [Aphanomyces astaci]ETV77303.1 hypothetical protein H257_08751 [Aphanomyces astaci]|eukprot:XP_009833090.1 hypothetical protein H257_08751 [Aphanomyces astaci]